MSEVSPLLKTRSRSQAKRPRRVVCPKHLAYIASLPCCVCDYPGPSECHHLRSRASTACAGRKSGDDEVLPCCAEHHRGAFGVHQSDRGEAEFWRYHKIDAEMLAARLWSESHAGPMP